MVVFHLCLLFIHKSSFLSTSTQAGCRNFIKNVGSKP